MKRLLFFFAATGLLIACSKSDSFLGSFGNSLKNGQIEPIVDLKLNPGTLFSLSGSSLYKTWTVKEGLVIQNAIVECTAEIEILTDRNFRFSFQESDPDGNAATYFGKISSSGELRFQFPAPLVVFPDGTELYITDILKSHGCVTDVWGPGVNEGTLYFNGRFDGCHFYAEAKFKAMVNETCPDLFNPTYNGPVNWIFGYDLTVQK